MCEGFDVEYLGVLWKQQMLCSIGWNQNVID